MAERSTSAVANTAWVKHTQEAKLKTEAEKAAAAKAAFEATFKAVDKTREKQSVVSDSDSDETEDFESKPIGHVDPSKSTAAGSGIGGGTACTPTTFVVVTKDADGRKVPYGGAQIKVKVSPGTGIGGSDQEGIVKDMGDGTYTVTYAVQKRGNYMVDVECNGKPIMGSPFPVFFSAGTSTGGLLGLAPPTFPNIGNQSMPNMTNYSGSVSGAFPGLIGMIPGAVSGSSGGIILPGIGASFGEICRDYLNGLCSKTDCKLTHPPHNLLMAAVTATNSMGTLSQAPMPPSAAAMAAAQAIVALQAWNAHTAQTQAQTQSAKDSAGSSEKAGKVDLLKKTLQVSNLSPLLTVEQLKQLFNLYGTIRECFITDSKHFAYIAYSKPEEATAALALNNMDIGGRPLNVEMAKSLPQRLLSSSLASSTSPSMVEQHTIVMQQQFQQALLMQQTMITQMAANKAAAAKSKADLAAARAAEISKKLSVDGVGNEEKEKKIKSRSPSPSHEGLRLKSASPINYRRRQRSQSYSPRPRHSRDHRSRSPLRHHYSRYKNERSYRYRDHRDKGGRGSDRSNNNHSSVSRRNRSRSLSPSRRTYRDDSLSPRYRESAPRRIKKSSHTLSKSPSHHKRNRPSPSNDDECKERCQRHSWSKSIEDKVSDKRAGSSERKLKHKERRQSRSLSAEDKLYRSTRSTLSKKNYSRSKHRRQSRSRSLEGKQQSTDKLDESKQLKCWEKRSRSKSEEQDRQLAEGTEKSRDRRSKHHHRRRSRSKSVEAKPHQKEKEGGDAKYKKSEKLVTKHSSMISSEAKNRKRSTSPIENLDDICLNHKRHPGTKSTNKKHFSNGVDDDRDEKIQLHVDTRLTPMSEELED